MGNPQSKLTSRLVKRLLREAVPWKKIDHPNIVPLIGYSLDESSMTAALICLWYENGNLWGYLADHPTVGLKRFGENFVPTPSTHYELNTRLSSWYSPRNRVSSQSDSSNYSRRP